MSKLKFTFFIFAIAILVSCGNSSNDANSINETLRELIKTGYSVKELSIRTDYDEETIINAFLKDENVLTDSSKNEKILKILELHEDGGIIPVNKTNISAYNSIWQIYTKAQNLPRTSIFSGIGVSKVAGALMKRKSLNEDDSIRALVAYVNMKYDLEDMPPSLDRYFKKTSAIKDIVVPTTFKVDYDDEVKLKIDYYIYQNEQFEFKANENLKKSIENKIDNHIKNAVDSFISEDIGSLINTTKSVFMDSLGQAEFYKQKLSERLSLSELNNGVRDEILSYCVSVSCSRAILINEVLNYREFSNSLDVSEQVLLSDYVAKLEELTYLMEKKRDNLRPEAIESVLFAVDILFISKFQLSMILADFDMLIKYAFNYDENEIIIKQQEKKMQESLKKEINKNLKKSLNCKGNYYEGLNQNTTDYYKQIRDHFNIN